MAKAETKTTRELRREVEALRAQLKSGGLVSTKKTQFTKTSEAEVSSKFSTIDDKLIKKDFVKTIILSAFAFSIIIAIWIFKINLSFL